MEIKDKLPLDLDYGNDFKDPDELQGQLDTYY